MWDHNGDWELFHEAESVAHTTGRTGTRNPRKRLSRDELQKTNSTATGLEDVMGNNGDKKDQKENSRWRCPYCHASGPCVKGDEKMTVLMHLTGCDEFEKRKK